MPDEPAKNCKDPITVLRIKTPNGETLTRRFKADEPLKHLVYYVTSKGYDVEGFKLLTTFPRRDVSLYYILLSHVQYGKRNCFNMIH